MLDELDEIDKNILRHLQSNARITNKDLAKELGLSVTPVFERVKKLERKGYIKKYVAVLDHEKLNHGLVVFMHIKMQSHNHESISLLMEAVNHLNEVMECYHVTGETDFLMKVLVPDMKSYEEFVLNKLTRISGIGNINSSMVMSAVKQNMNIPI
jgi:Lrp/AsnC family leucine-responsive transcriptional regulator